MTTDETLASLNAAEQIASALIVARSMQADMPLIRAAVARAHPGIGEDAEALMAQEVADAMRRARIEVGFRAPAPVPVGAPQ